ncbi:MAG: hemerythrin family protein [Geobacteraceae bacterium]|nr:hemerythrin family protein [Geobacteraceae bacterium]
MPYIEWSDSFSVKVKEIDDQHKKLIGMINKLHDAMLANRGREVQAEIIFEMLEYVSYHFTTEEKYMSSFAYPGYEAHKREHLEFAAEVADLKARIDRGALILSIMPLSLLRDWLQNHILGTDMKYSDLFNSKGLK